MSTDDRLTRFGQPQRFALSQVQGDGWSSNSTLNAEHTYSCHCERLKGASQSYVLGFTLAEVLLTLGIIGVVAALAIPTLISNNNKRIVETRLAKFYSSINQAIELSEVENGPKEKWEMPGYGFEKDTDNEDDTSKPIARTWVDKYLEPYLKLSKIEYDAYGGAILYLLDSSVVALANEHWVFYPKVKDYINEATNNVDAQYGKGKFIFYFYPSRKDDPYYYKKGVEPYVANWDGTESSLRNNNSHGCNLNSGRHYCTQLIRMNGWKIPDDYPFKF
ncbi:type II secretion system protein [bacterium]|nr:type II secretion system protein [bacterium]